jgi:phenylacetic acid degradation operon negative regulatory protein
MPNCTDILAERFLKPSPPKAAQLIVTIYGDIVEPRGGVLWMGDLISLCAGFGVNESLVRTAVSRLVSKGQLVGEREGRRSFYALTPEAREEYHLAADLFFGPADSECGWILTYCVKPAEQAVLLRHGFACLDGDIYAGADRPGQPRLGIAFQAEALKSGVQGLSELVNERFALADLSREYAEFISRFLPMREYLADGLTPQSALLFRLALVHAYRGIRLRDPRLSRTVLPADWPGDTARSLFAGLYAGLSQDADRYIGEHLLNQEGPLAAHPDPVRERMQSLSASA